MTIEEIKNTSDITEVVSRYTELKRQGGKLQAVVNPLREERTSSFFIYEDTQKYHDFGTGEGGDIVDFIKAVEKLDTNEAVTFLSGGNFSIQLKARPIPKDKNPEITESRYREIVSDVNSFDPGTFKNQDYKTEALTIAPAFIWKEASSISIGLFQTFTAYDSINKTLVIKICDYQGKLISYKRRRYKDQKWHSAYGTHPNKQCLLSIMDKTDTVYVVEGMHDYLTAVLMGLNVLAIPTVGYTKFNSTELQTLKDRYVYFVPDLDVNKSIGIDCMLNLETQLKGVAIDTKVLIIKDVLDAMDISFTGDKLDLSESVELWEGTLRDFVNTLQYVGDIGVQTIGEVF